MTEKQKFYTHDFDRTPQTNSPTKWITKATKQEFGESWEKCKQHGEACLLIIDHRTGQFKQQELKSMEETLSSREKKRLIKYQFQNDKLNYLERTAILRQLLGITLEQSASELKFGRNKYGKPHIKTHKPIEFNISHSKGLTLIGIHPKSSIGVDVEKINSNIKWQSIANRWFPPEITRRLQSTPKEEQLKEFFNIWCKFEAILKCNGEGLTNLKSSNIMLNKADQSASSVKIEDGFEAAVAVTQLPTGNRQSELIPINQKAV